MDVTFSKLVHTDLKEPQIRDDNGQVQLQTFSKKRVGFVMTAGISNIHVKLSVVTVICTAIISVARRKLSRFFAEI